MATVHVPGVALTSSSGKIGSQPFAVIHHWQFGTQTNRWTQPDLDLLATIIDTAWSTHLRAECGTNVSLLQVVASDLTDNQSLQSTVVATAGLGSRVGLHEPASAAVLVRNRIVARYRGGHPRTYWPFGVPADFQDEFNWTTALTTDVLTTVQAWVSQVTGAAYSVSGNPLKQVVPRYTYSITDDTVHKKYVRERTGLLGVNPVIGYEVMKPISSQRRRMTIG